MLHAGGRPLRGVRVGNNFSRLMMASSRRARSSRSSAIVFKTSMVCPSPQVEGPQIPSNPSCIYPTCLLDDKLRPGPVGTRRVPSVVRPKFCLFCGAGNPARSRLSGGFFASCASLRSRSRRLKAGGSQDWLPHSQVHTRYSACRRPLAELSQHDHCEIVALSALV